MRLLSPIFTALILLTAACRGGGGDDVADDAGDDTTGDDTTIYMIQDPTNVVPVGTVVTMRGVVVTAIDNYGERADGTRKGNIWVQEPGGGEYSGVLVFNAPLDQVSMLAVGDVIDLAGAEKVEFALTSDTSGRTTTELQPPEGGAITITKVSSGSAPAPADVDALAIAMMDQAGKDAEWEKWEGVLIQVQNVSQISGISQISGEANFLRFQVTGRLELDTSLSAFPAGVDRDVCYASITGIGDYFFSHKILIREASAIVSGGTSCPAAEEGAGVCSDGMDNDYDGFSDCEDFSCQDTDPACVTSTTVASIQMGDATGTVMLDDVVITAVDDLGTTSKGIWVADDLQAAPYNGVLVFVGAGPIQPNWVIGATVDVTGNVSEFDLGSPPVGDTLTEVDARNGSVTFVSAPGGAPMPLTNAPITSLNDIATGEQYEGVLVRLTNLRVTNEDAGQGKVELTDNNGETILMDDDAFAYNMSPSPPTNGTCYSSVTGVSNLQVIDDVRTLAPRSAADMVEGSGCN